MIDLITVKATLIIELKTKTDWIRKIPDYLPRKLPGESFLFIDKNGNVLFIGIDFTVAEDQNTYPVFVYRLESVSDKYKTV